MVTTRESGIKNTISGEASVGVAAHWKCLLYGATGLDTSVGITGSASCEGTITVLEPYAGAAENSSGGEKKLETVGEQPNFDIEGNATIEIGPEIQGTLVVELPIIHKKLVAQGLFSIKLKQPFWSKTWDSKELETETELETESESIEESTEAPETEPAETEVEASAPGWLTYTTQYGGMTGTQTFQFDYPEGWTVEQADVAPTKSIEEIVTISNARGVSIEYRACSHEWGAVGGARWTGYKGTLTKVGESAFIPSVPTGTDMDCSDLGTFMVGKLQVEEEMAFGLYDYVPIEGDFYFYAVLPTSYLTEGKTEFGLQDGFADDVSFDYPEPISYSIRSTAPEGKFTEQEEQEVIRILGSFRTVD